MVDRCRIKTFLIYPLFGIHIIRQYSYQGVVLSTTFWFIDSKVFVKLKSSLQKFYGRHHGLVVTEYLCHKWPRICSNYCNHNPVLNKTTGSFYSIFSFMCMFCRSLFVLLYFFVSPLCYLSFFDLRILINPLISSYSSCSGQTIQNCLSSNSQRSLYKSVIPQRPCFRNYPTLCPKKCICIKLRNVFRPSYDMFYDDYLSCIPLYVQV